MGTFYTLKIELLKIASKKSLVQVPKKVEKDDFTRTRTGDFHGSAAFTLSLTMLT